MAEAHSLGSRHGGRAGQSRGGRPARAHPTGDEILMGIAAGILITIVLFAYIFWPDKNPFRQQDKTRVDYLRERKDVIYDNLRDLNFEYLAGKYPEQDYADQRAGLEDEAAQVIAELEVLSSHGIVGRAKS